MAITCEFTVRPDQLVLRTQTNGDHIVLSGFHLGPESASNLAWLINSPNGNLVVKFKQEKDSV